MPCPLHSDPRAKSRGARLFEDHSVSVKQLDKSTLEETDKRDGKVISATRMTVAADGKSMTVAFDDKLHGTTGRIVAQKQ